MSEITVNELKTYIMNEDPDGDALRILNYWTNKYDIKLKQYPIWLELPIDYQDDVDALNLIRLLRDEPPYTPERLKMELQLMDLCQGWDSSYQYLEEYEYTWSDDYE